MAPKNSNAAVHRAGGFADFRAFLVPVKEIDSYDESAISAS